MKYLVVLGSILIDQVIKYTQKQASEYVNEIKHDFSPSCLRKLQKLKEN